MSERKTAYIVNAPATTNPALICGECKTALAYYVRGQDGRVWVLVGNLVLSSAHGRCVCGAEWHWVASEKRLEDLLERLRALREVSGI